MSGDSLNRYMSDGLDKSMPYEKKLQSQPAQQLPINMQQQNGLRAYVGMSLPQLNPYAAASIATAPSAAAALEPNSMANLVQRLQSNMLLQNTATLLHDAALMNLLTSDALQHSGTVAMPVSMLGYIPNGLETAFGVLHSQLFPYPYIYPYPYLPQIGYYGLDFLPILSVLLEQERQALLQLIQLSTQDTVSSASMANNNLQNQYGIQTNGEQPDVANNIELNQLASNRSQPNSSGFGSFGSPHSVSLYSDRLSPSELPLLLPLLSKTTCQISPPTYIQLKFQQEQKEQEQQNQKQSQLFQVPSGVDIPYNNMDNIDNSKDMAAQSQGFNGFNNKYASPFYPSFQYKSNFSLSDSSLPEDLYKVDADVTDLKRFEESSYDKIRNTKIKGYNRRVYFNGEDYVFDNDEVPPPGEKRTYLLLSDNTLNAEKHIKPAQPGPAFSTALDCNTIPGPLDQHDGRTFDSSTDTYTISSINKAMQSSHELNVGAGDSNMIHKDNFKEFLLSTIYSTLLNNASKEVKSDSLHIPRETKNLEKVMDENSEEKLSYESSKEWPPLPRPQLASFKNTSNVITNVTMKSPVGKKRSKNNAPKKQQKSQVGQKNGRRNWRCISSDLL